MKKNNKGITLIALVVTIIVLLILAGVSIAVLTGQNGILNRATEAKKTNENKQAEEELRLGISALTIDYRKNTTNATSFRDYVMANTQALANAMGVDANELSMDTDNYAVTYKGQTYTITDDGRLEPFVLVPLTAFNIVEESLEVAEGETKKLTIQKTPSNANERIVWTSSDNTIATVDENGNVTGVKNGAQTATISAVSKSGNVSSSTSCAVTVTKSLGYFKTIVTNQTTGDGVAYYFSSPSATNGTPITANNMGQFLGMKVNYVADPSTSSSRFSDRATETTYRIFYIDVTGKYGDGAGTIYLKQDCDEHNVVMASNSTNLSTLYNGLDNNNKMAQLNPDWAEKDDATDSDNDGKTYKINDDAEKAVSYLCNTTVWQYYKDAAGANQIARYVVGAPSIEMWVDSYNAFIDYNSDKGLVKSTVATDNSWSGKLETEYNTTREYGYKIGMVGDNYTNGSDYGSYYTANYSLISSADQTNSELVDLLRIYLHGPWANYWLSSPSACGTSWLCLVSRKWEPLLYKYPAL